MVNDISTADHLFSRKHFDEGVRLNKVLLSFLEVESSNIHRNGIWYILRQSNVHKYKQSLLLLLIHKK